MTSPSAEVEIDPALIDGLVRAQFPKLVGEVRIVASGWDNVIARLGDDLCVRMPQRALSAPLVQNEADWLPRLASVLPIEVPSAVTIGQPDLGYPWRWLVCPWFEGQPLASVMDRDRVRVATQLGEFVSVLHSTAPSEAPVSPWRGIALADVATETAERLEQLEPADADTLSAAWSRCVDAPATQRPTSMAAR